MPVEVKASTATLAHERIAVEDTAVAALRYEGGGLGVVEGATSAFPGWTKRIEISGDKGSVILEDDTIKFWQFAEETPEDEQIRKGAPVARTSAEARQIPWPSARKDIAGKLRISAEPSVKVANRQLRAPTRGAPLH
jgi:predicted dehydrogenase